MSVYKRGGVYWYDFWFRGQRLRQSTGLNNKTAALRAEAIRKAELAEGRAGIAKRKTCPTFESFVANEFLPWSEKQHEAHPKTYKRYKVSSKPLIAFFGKIPLDAITSGQVEKFKLARASEISPAGTNRDLAALRFMLNFAIRQEYIERNPVSAVKLLPEGPGCMRVVSHEEQQKYLAVANPLLQDVAVLILETGMRPEEVYTIRNENVHLQTGYYETAGKRKSGTTRKGNRWARKALCEAAWAASKTKATYLQAQFRRLAALRGSKRAVVAVASTILTIGYYMLQRGTTYQELGGDYFDKRNALRTTRRLVKRLEALGHKVILEPMHQPWALQPSS